MMFLVSLCIHIKCHVIKIRRRIDRGLLKIAILKKNW